MIFSAGVLNSFSVSYSANNLFVALSVYDLSTGSPVLVSGPAIAPLVSGTYTYAATYTPVNGKTYLFMLAAYTDGTYTTLNTSYGEQTYVGTAQYTAPPAQNVIGVVGCPGNTTANIGCPFMIFLGDAKTMYLQALNGGNSGNPLDLTSCTQISVPLPNADGSFTTLLLTAGQVVITAPAVLGQFTVPISSVKSALLNTGQFQDLDVTFTIAGVVFTVPFVRAFSVFEVA